ncbi:MAG: hypothetical protein KKE02_21125 [Alphaproteobacteria bacterium]|nr:hypothetical protein [Alphaproteobacteria bacterium]MBU1514461.1 hypothetical protein [Alphaproteobacteria bacterium]MBU2096907.1 hypothetical protein [Alphaproteobacteria bacterium]MBU2153534.1 hypothetical protein [Alphaproteobacteria bacterium]MBU2305961.1 hypothetical protein [Alphaproteobacteria bacterium]
MKTPIGRARPAAAITADARFQIVDTAQGKLRVMTGGGVGMLKGMHDGYDTCGRNRSADQLAYPVMGLNRASIEAS